MRDSRTVEEGGRLLESRGRDKRAAPSGETRKGCAEKMGSEQMEQMGSVPILGKGRATPADPAVRRRKRRPPRGSASCVRGVRASDADPLALVSAPYLAGLLKCSIRTLYRRALAGELPMPFKIHRTRYWRRRVIEAWLAGKDGKRQ